MGALLLARIQFGISIGVHYIFPVTTLGLAFFILLFETFYYFGKNDLNKKISSFLTGILGLVFVLGVATGILLPFSFGANWARFSVFSGAVFGIQLAAESVTAFALESAFLAVLVFGRKKVSPFVYWLSALFVFLGSHLSAFWIVSANSWMQTPAGYALENGRVVLKDVFQAVFNPSAVIRFIHVVSAAWLTGAVLLAGIGAYYLQKNKNGEFSKKLIKSALLPFIICSSLQAVLGHTHIMEVKKYQPIKSAAYEGIFETVNGAPLYAFGIPDAKNRKIHFAVGFPYMLSFLESGRFDSRVEGLEEYPESEWPPVDTIFTTFHLMVFIGVVLIGAGFLGGLLYLMKKIYSTKWYLALLTIMIPLPYLSNELGWMGTEIGRQPWTIYGLLKTPEASSAAVPAGSIAASLVLISVIYLALLAGFVLSLVHSVRTGPEE